MQILIIDDEQASITLMQLLLRKLPDCESIAFMDSVAALAWCMANEPDLVVVDYTMPQMDGLEFTERFRERYSDIPVLMVTAEYKSDLRYRALALGLTDFLYKPLDHAEFLVRVKNALALRKSFKDRLTSLSTLAAGIAHDFNNQMTILMGYLEVLRATINDNQAQETFDSMTQVLNRNEGLVSKLRVIGSNSIERSENFCLANLLTDEYKYLVLLIGDVRLTLNPIPNFRNINSEHNELDSQESDSSLYQVYGDKSTFRQVLDNLCINAKHALAGKESAHIQLSLERIEGKEKQESKLCLQVSDNGSGMTPEVLKNIFEPYFTTKPEGEGTGLGLFVVHGIIHNMRGKITCESELGKGTNFTITLPVATAPLM